MKLNLSILGACLATISVVAPSSANDSSAEIGLGGLVLTRNDAIALDSEELFISPNRVKIKYRFRNTTDKDVETLVAFPMPVIPDSVPDFNYLGDAGYPDWTELSFKTTVDGVAVPLNRVDVVMADGKRVGTSLKDLRGGKDGGPYPPGWTLATTFTRTQVFPAGKTITVEHSYVPVAGVSLSSGLSGPEYRDHYEQRWCVDRDFFAGLRKMNDYYTVYLSYVLKSGANWKGSIKDFRLVVDKGDPESLVSFCMEGVKQISPTQFEVRKANFEPARDLRILIVNPMTSQKCPTSPAASGSRSASSW